MDVAKYIYAQHWLYTVYSISLGPLGYPAPIKYADHYASMWQDFIGALDDTLEGLISSPELHYPQVISLLKDKKINDDKDEIHDNEKCNNKDQK